MAVPGVGLMYNPVVPEFLRARLDAVDYVEITSDMFWTDHGAGRAPRFEYLESWVEVLDWLAARKPLVAHNVGLSIGSAGGLDHEYVEHLAQWSKRYRFAWQSDHLSFSVLRGSAGPDHSVGIAAPLPFDVEVLEAVVQRVAEVRRRLPGPFLLENGVYYVLVPEQDMQEHEFLNALTRRSGCGLLLDLHNLYVNARNHGFDPFEFVDALALDAVQEVHIAGGTEFAGMYTDSHSGPCHPMVWKLLDHVVPMAKSLRGVTFEFHDSYYPLLGQEGILEQLARAREILAPHSRPRRIHEPAELSVSHS